MCGGLGGLNRAVDTLPVETGLGNQRNVIDNPLNSVNLRMPRVGLAAG